MRWTLKTRNSKREALKTWHDYFAWKPVEIKEGHFVWFEKVLRRAVQVGEYESLGRRRVGKKYQQQTPRNALPLGIHRHPRATEETVINRTITDMLDRPLEIGDFVVFYNGVYQFHSIPDVKYLKSGDGAAINIIRLDKQKTTKPVKKYSKYVCLLNKDDVLLWLLKRKSE